MSQQQTGIVTIKLGGAVVNSLPGATLDMGGISRKAVVGHAVYGYANSLKPSEVTMDLSHDAATDLEALGSLVGVTLEFICDSGVTYMIPDAFCADPPMLTEKDSGAPVKFKFNGSPATKS